MESYVHTSIEGLNQQAYVNKPTNILTLKDLSKYRYNIANPLLKIDQKNMGVLPKP